MVRPRVVLSESKIRTRKTPICLSRVTLARGEFGGAWARAMLNGVSSSPGLRGLRANL